MKLLVGTLVTIEEEFEACCASIQAQSYRDLDHVVIRDLPKQEAHEALYGMFMRRADEYDLLVKVDADMVIGDRDLFAKIVERFQSDSQLDLLLIAVHDYFTDGLLIGMNVFRNTVRWKLGEEALFTDMTYDRATIRKMAKDHTELAPAAVHCANPSPFQAYHYGFHRAMKALRGGKRWNHLEALCAHYRRSPDPRLAHAILGANAAFDPGFSAEHISYNNDALLKHFERHCAGKPEAQIHRAARRTRIYWLFKLPLVRRVVYRYYRLKAGLRDRRTRISPSLSSGPAG